MFIGKNNDNAQAKQGLGHTVHAKVDYRDPKYNRILSNIGFESMIYLAKTKDMLFKIDDLK